MSESYLIVGLGNPGEEYRHTRHNFGFLAVAHIVRQNQSRFKSLPGCQALSAEGTWAGKRCSLVMPSTFMNKSGEAVKLVLLKKDIPLERMLVLYDDLHIEFGQLRLREKGSAGGHNGLSSIIHHVNSNEFPRLRLGIGRAGGGAGSEIRNVSSENTDKVKFVLGEFNKKEKDLLPLIVEQAHACCLLWLQGDINKAMSEFNSKQVKSMDKD